MNLWHFIKFVKIRKNLFNHFQILFWTAIIILRGLKKLQLQLQLQLTLAIAIDTKNYNCNLQIYKFTIYNYNLQKITTLDCRMQTFLKSRILK